MPRHRLYHRQGAIRTDRIWTRHDRALRGDIAATLRAMTKLGGEVEQTALGSLPNDGKVIADER